MTTARKPLATTRRKPPSTRGKKPSPTKAEKPLPTMGEASSDDREPVGYMSLYRQLLELRFPLETAAYVAMRPFLRMLHIAGDQHAVLVLPGGMGADGSTFFLRWGIRNLGYSVHGWGQGRNLGCDEQKLNGLRARVKELYDLHNAKISVVGWSLGGIYSRMLARDMPEKIRQVITLGSPFRMVESDRFAHRPFGRGRWEKFVKNHAAQLDLLRVHEHSRPPITVPTTAIYSRRDGFAPWQLSIDETGPNAPNPRAENVEIRGSHIGLSSNPIALAVVLDRLAQPEGQWRPFRPMPALQPFFLPPATWIPPAELSRRESQRRGA
jgi:pimeloyl-ACP methyl ester carboxylesterase